MQIHSECSMTTIKFSAQPFQWDFMWFWLIVLKYSRNKQKNIYIKNKTTNKYNLIQQLQSMVGISLKFHIDGIVIGICWWNKCCMKTHKTEIKTKMKLYLYIRMQFVRRNEQQQKPNSLLLTGNGDVAKLKLNTTKSNLMLS